MSRLIVLLCMMCVLWAACPAPTPENEPTGPDGGVDGVVLQEPSTEVRVESPQEPFVTDAGVVDRTGETKELVPEVEMPKEELPKEKGQDTMPPDTLPEMRKEAISEPALPEMTVREIPAEVAPETPASTCSIPTSCDAIRQAFQTEFARIRRCDKDADCGQALSGTSCGCTRARVAAKNADTTCFYRIIKAAGKRSCDLGLTSTCDCPPANGFVCKNNVCVWNYTRP